MAAIFTYIQHPRLKEMEAEGPVKVRAIAKKRAESSTGVRRFNRKLGLGITTSVGTMWAAYAFAALALLPIIIVGQNIQSAASDARSAATYKDAGAILQESRQIQDHLLAQDQATSALLDKVAALEAALAKK
jgi:hypothetical protein